MVDEIYRTMIEDKVFTAENCYCFIPNREIYTEEGRKISEWTVDLDSKS